jgi:probable F420-dependent oxidoreductase
MTRPCKVGVQLPEVERFVSWPEYLDLARRSEEAGFDSIWVGDHLIYDLPDGSTRGPYEAWTTLAAIAAVTERVEIGPLVASTGFHAPAMLAKQAATVDAISQGRLIVALGAGWNRREFDAFGFPYDRRVSRFEEALAIIAPLLREGRTTFHGEFFDVDDVSVGFAPEKPLDLWLGGRAPVALRRIGRLADGWLASFVTPAEAAAGIDVITDAAAQSGRAMDDEHYGVSLAVCFGSVPAPLLEAARRRRPDLDPATFAPVGWDALVELVRSFTDAGVSKFVVRPALPPDEWPRFVDEFVERLHPLQA